jgi:hypothetical protein
VALEKTDVSEELSPSIIRVTRIDEIGKTLERRNVPECRYVKIFHSIVMLLSFFNFNIYGGK